ncbi:uncharacterized protein LOC129769379 [Toxorhynchites rutilus septentrionalis]|uniref:uncharacterized protein LOC129769379 n=1 Tax=Toxorhynchites rutilus septentrionalis TaxID=329112 RepID=UPI0024790B45|nr:uncharacterized protein LOC129769379 [Toxorhynchites rutilus septentrionalis]
MKDMILALPRWIRVSAVVLGIGVGTELIYEMYHSLRAYHERREARRRVGRELTEVYFANERSIEGYATGTSMDDFIKEHVNRIVGFLDRARMSINLCMYIITVDSIADAVLRAAKRGVRIRVVGCSTMAYSSGSQMIKLVREGIPVRFNRMDDARLMHHKFCLIDTDWLCPRCYHMENVRKSGFCCDAMNDGTIIDNNANECGKNVDRMKTGRRARCELVDDGSQNGCSRCNLQQKRKIEKCQIQEMGTEPLPLGGMIISGSTNWTMQALSGNWDNMIITSKADIVLPFQLEFQRLWKEFANLPPVISANSERSVNEQ